LAQGGGRRLGITHALLHAAEYSQRLGLTKRYAAFTVEGEGLPQEPVRLGVIAGAMGHVAADRVDVGLAVRVADLLVQRERLVQVPDGRLVLPGDGVDGA